ncbi:DUF2141 domain-containing protein [bacterium]|nr:DUF2141 domain-containing protein [bacterium]
MLQRFCLVGLFVIVPALLGFAEKGVHPTVMPEQTEQNTISSSPPKKKVTLNSIQPEKPLLTEKDQRTKGTLIVQIKQLRNDRGNLKVSIFNKPDGFPVGGKNALRNLIVPITPTQTEAVFENLPLDSYAVSIWHDENKDNKINTNWIGMPKEGLGVSRDAKGSFGPPKYHDARFDFNTKKMIILINTTYL